MMSSIAITITDNQPQDNTAQLSASAVLDGSLDMSTNMNSNSNSNKRGLVQTLAQPAAIVSDDESSDSEDEASVMVSQEQPAAKRQRTTQPQQQQQQPAQKSVSFADFALFRPIPSRDEYHPSAMASMYRTRQEMSSTKEDIVRTLKGIEEEGVCVRGLEKYIPSQSAGRTQRIRGSIAAVLQMQQNKASATDMARAYQQMTGPSVCCAYMRGTLDEREVIQSDGDSGSDGNGSANENAEDDLALQMEIVAKYNRSTMVI
eukprot:CAMPEP_0119570132 /NCGR_PEP_ID=MMETSP1352-20130426/43458_1 /TAXON_ID=265584 /ORGANISM="Stauroneis constricta, Strain CCMP1120" /LENGTH=259 /DNA_ID=CAMNT_0007619797 /DNA_START=172 /DNA_END=952 /DNA_ORIENTATION=-